MKASRWAVVVTVLVGQAWLAGQPLVAAESDPEITGIQLGIDGHYKVGCWTRVEVSLTGGKEASHGQLEVTVPDGDGVPTQVVSLPQRPIALAAGTQTTATVFAKIGQMTPSVRVRLLVDGNAIASREFNADGSYLPDAVASERPMIVTVGRPLAISARNESDDKQTGPIFATIDRPSQFPTRWYGYDGVAAMIVCTSDPARFASLSSGDARMKALREWVQLGGTLVVSAGAKADEMLAPGAPLADFLPGKYAGTVPLRRTNAWETYSETTERLDTRAIVDAVGRLNLDTPRLENVRGRIEAYEGSRPQDLPLVVRSALGLGVVVFVAADLDRPPFTTWAAREQFLDKLLGREPRKSQAGGPAAVKLSASSTVGYVDLAGQLRSALEQFEGVKLVPFSLVATLIIIYILAIGPFDYFLLRRGLKRMEFTWLTFPILVLAFSGMSYFLAHWLKGDQLRVNQVDVIDYDTDSTLVRGTSWSNLFSPRVDAYDLSYTPVLTDETAPDDRQLLTAWTGLPGAGFGGMGSPSGATALFTGSYQFSPTLDAVKRMPIAVWSTKGITGRWHGTATSPLVADLTDHDDHLLSGTLQSNLDHELTDCVLIYDRWAYPIDKLEPQARMTIERQLDPQTFDTYFKQSSLYDNQTTLSTYDASGRQVEKIVEAMMFYEHLGGQAYVGLSNEFQQFLDVSGLLRCGRAVLFARGPVSGGQLLRDGKPLANEGDRRWTFYRFVFSVKPAGGE